jgi:hypothetical protein
MSEGKPWEKATDCKHVSQHFDVLVTCRACIKRACIEYAAPLVEAVRMALELHEDGLIDFKFWKLKVDEDINVRYRDLIARYRADADGGDK